MMTKTISGDSADASVNKGEYKISETCVTGLSWTSELLEVKTGTSDPDIIDLKYELVRLSRSKFGISGFMDIKVDLYDDVTVRCTVERSKYRAGPYTLFPMSIENQTLSQIMNVYYKSLLQPDLLKCCDNAPIVKDKFKAPLTKRYVTITNCSSTTNNLPDILMEGYYRLRVLLSGPVDVFVQTLALIEQTFY